MMGQIPDMCSWSQYPAELRGEHGWSRSAKHVSISTRAPSSKANAHRAGTGNEREWPWPPGTEKHWPHPSSSYQEGGPSGASQVSWRSQTSLLLMWNLTHFKQWQLMDKTLSVLCGSNKTRPRARCAYRQAAQVSDRKAVCPPESQWCSMKLQAYPATQLPATQNCCCLHF